MRRINLNRQLLGLEDLLFGVGTVLQTRAGQQVEVTKINAGNLPFNETQSLIEWATTVNLEELGSMTTELQAIYNNLASVNIVSNDTTEINALAAITTELHTLYTNISAIQNNSNNMVAINSLHTNMTALLSIYTNIVPNLTEILNIDTLAAQVAQDKQDVSAMRVAVETIYDTFDDRFLGAKTTDPTLDNDGNALIDGALYFNNSATAMKVYSISTHLWYTIPQIYLSGLLDVTLTSITTGDILTWNGTKWVNTRTPSFYSIKLNGGTSTAGTATWNNTELTYDLVLNDNVALQVGQEEVVYCKNNTLTTIPNGKPVMAVGTNGNSGNILIDLHDGTKVSAKRIIGLTTQAILPSNNVNPYGFVTRNGKVRGLNTTGSDYGETWLDGDILYVKATGALTKVEPADTELKMPIAFVIHAHTNGTLYVRTTGIDENHDRGFINDLADVHSKTAKTTLVDADEIMLADSTSTWSLKKITWANIKTALTSLFILKVNTPTTNALGKIDANGTIGNSNVINDSSGNVGIGVTPSAWGSAGNITTSSIGSNSIQFLVGANAYYNSGYKYASTGVASQYEQYNGIHYWKTASSGTAGNVITWINAMSLGSNGNLLIGTTVDNGVDKLQVSGSIRADKLTSFQNKRATNSPGGMTGYFGDKIEYAIRNTSGSTSKTFRVTNSLPSNNENFGLFLKARWALYNQTPCMGSYEYCVGFRQPGASATCIFVHATPGNAIGSSSPISVSSVAVNSASFDVTITVTSNYTNVSLELEGMYSAGTCTITPL